MKPTFPVFCVSKILNASSAFSNGNLCVTMLSNVRLCLIMKSTQSKYRLILLTLAPVIHIPFNGKIPVGMDGFQDLNPAPTMPTFPRGLTDLMASIEAVGFPVKSRDTSTPSP